MNPASIPVEKLLAHREWVRCVARAVVRDPNAADDIEQETWLAALRTPPRRDTSLRGWLGAVVRSRARRLERTDERRGRRELAASRDEATALASDLVEMADTHRRVVQAVVELDEPFRSTILLRYFEGLSVEDVAARTSSPLETTRSRLKRGVAKLRERLSEELGTDDRKWELALVPLLGRTPESTAAPLATAAVTGGVLVGMKTIAAAVGMLLLVAGLWWTTSNRRDEAKPPVVADAATPPAAADSNVRPARAARIPAATAGVPPDVPPSAPPETVRAPVPAERPIKDRLADPVEPNEFLNESLLVSLARVAEDTHVPIVVSAEAAEQLERAAQSARPTRGSTGLINLGGPGQRLLNTLVKSSQLDFVIEDDRVVVVPSDKKWDPARPIVVLPVAPPQPPLLTVVGRVTDANGVTASGVEVVRIPAEFRRVTTDIAGRYEIRMRRPYGSLEARAPGQFSSLAVPVTGQPGEVVTVDLVLRGPGGSVTVHVTTDEGPREGAWVSIGAREDVKVKLPDGRVAEDLALNGKTDPLGIATFPSVQPGESPVIVHLASYEDAKSTVNVKAGQDAPVELKLVKKPPLKDRVEKARISCRFNDMNLNGAVMYFSTATKVNVVVMPGVEAGGPKRITLTLDDQPLTSALRDICTQLGGVDYELSEAYDAVLIKVKKQ